MDEQRDQKGKFAKGWKGGPGRPKKAKDQRYYEILQKKLTFKKWEQILDTAIEQAIEGDKEARKFLAGYAMGEPDRYLELGGPDGQGITFDVHYVNPPPEQE